MTALVDTSVWSLALRRRPADLSRQERQVVAALRDLIDRGGAVIAGPIRQELLSGIRDEEQYLRLREALAHFPHVRVEEEDYDRAAECFNACRRGGITPTAIDMLLCAVALRSELPLMTTDRDFSMFAEVLGLTLVEIG